MPIVREIKFDGFVFRSKIESQNYLFWKTLGIECYYESDTIALKRGDKIVNYLPDFFLPDLGKSGSYFEVKLDKNPTVDECQKCFMLAVQTNKDVYLFYEQIGRQKNGYKYCATTGAFVPQMQWTQCPKCSAFGITHMGLVAEMPCGCCNEMVDLTNSSSYDITEAVKVVRAERFGA